MKKEGMLMNYSICMKNECQNCKKRLMCFKEEEFYREYSKNKHKKSKTKKVVNKKGSTNNVR